MALADYNIIMGSEHRIGTCLFGAEGGPISFAPECFAENKDGRKRLLLWGDSNAAALYPGLRALDSLGANIAQLTSEHAHLGTMLLGQLRSH